MKIPNSLSLAAFIQFHSCSKADPARTLSVLISVYCCIYGNKGIFRLSLTSWPGGLMVRRCFPVAKIAGSSPVWVVFYFYFWL